MALDVYRAKRNFSRTGEPAGTASKSHGKRTRLRYVIQQHAARRLHFDFRLELDGVLKSWAVPKGPSPDPADKRLAVHVEDHPLAYGDFEGTIPAGEYGGGTMQLWDQGWWQPVGDAAAGYRRGKLEFDLHGERLTGRWTLLRMHGKPGEGDKNWLLVKERGDAGGTGPTDTDVSVASGRTLDEIAAGTRVRRRRTPRFAESPSCSDHAPDAAPPKALRPMLATLVKTLPDDDGAWLHEIKLDGYRLLTRVDGERVRLYTRSGLDWTARLRPIADDIAQLKLPPCWLDGELVVFDTSGVSRFQLLQAALHDQAVERARYIVFDLPWCAGEDLRDQPLTQRKAQLEALLPSGADRLVRYGDHVAGHGAQFLAEACRHGLEGIIAKRADIAYQTTRSRDWLKLKCGARQEMVIGGFTEPKGARSGFGALLLGYYEGDALRYAGRVGTGFDDALLRSLHTRLRRLARDQSPFAELPPAARRGAHFVAPELVCEIAFSEWTDDGRLRHPSFLGLREDKNARQVLRERAAATPDRAHNKTRAIASKAIDTPAVTERRRVRGNAGDVRFAGIAITHPDRVVFPDQSLTKQALAEFYASIAPLALPHLRDRPLSLLRCPQGRGRTCFFQKHLGPGAPDAIGAVPVPEQDGTTARYPVVNDAAGLVALVQMGVMEIHPWGSRVDRLEQPDRLIFDFDPAPDVAFDAVKDTALQVRDVLAELGLHSFLKTSGGKGLHVVAPIERRATWDVVKDFCHGVAELLERAAPDRYIATASKARRRGRIFVDWLRNGRGATAIAPYVTRARAGAPVATPLAWEELRTLRAADEFTVANFATRLAHVRRADPWAGFFEVRQRLSADALRRLRR